MKKTILIAAVIVMAIASAFTTSKAYTNPMGWKRVAGVDRSGATDNSNCAVNGGSTNCYILSLGPLSAPAYDSESHIDNPNFILTHP